jgi:hypothetical protein
MKFLIIVHQIQELIQYISTISYVRTVQYRTTGGFRSSEAFMLISWDGELRVDYRISSYRNKKLHSKQFYHVVKETKKVNKSFLWSLQNPHHLPEKGSYPFTDRMGRKTKSLPQILPEGKISYMLCLLPSLKRGVFFDVTGKKISVLLDAIHSHLRQLILLPPMVFLYLRFLQQQLKVGEDLALFKFSLCFSLIPLYLYTNTCFPYRNHTWKCIEIRKT